MTLFEYNTFSEGEKVAKCQRIWPSSTRLSINIGPSPLKCSAMEICIPFLSRESLQKIDEDTQHIIQAAEATIVQNRILFILVRNRLPPTKCNELDLQKDEPVISVRFGDGSDFVLECEDSKCVFWNTSQRILCPHVLAAVNSQATSGDLQVSQHLQILPIDIDVIEGSLESMDCGSDKPTL